MPLEKCMSDMYQIIECNGVMHVFLRSNLQALTMCDSTSKQAASSKEDSPPLSRIGLNSNKAGMDGVDREKINQIILQASKGSKYYQNEVRKDHEITKRVERMLGILRGLSSDSKAAAMKAVDKKMRMMEKSRNLSRIIVHVDMDAFYAAIETRDNPHLKDVPMAVGSNSMLVIYLISRGNLWPGEVVLYWTQFSPPSLPPTSL